MCVQKNHSNFYVAAEVTELGIKAAGVVISGMKNEVENADFNVYRQGLLEDIKQHYQADMVEKDPVVQGFRLLHNKIGRSNKKYVASPESLLGVLFKYEKFPSINLIVDIYNCISLQTRLSLGAHDLDKVQGNVTLRMADGSENFLQLGRSGPKKVNAGEYCYIDDSHEILCRMECHQSEKTKIEPGSSNCIFIVQGNEYTSKEYILSATHRLLELLKKYCGGREGEVAFYAG
jgi:DNA/RNA-binding domain of Phe-tRNA-synthetase-like protein